jgi:hypothetical protein
MYYPYQRKIGTVVKSWDLWRVRFQLLISSENSLFFSAASIWEVVIKLGLGREDFKVVDGCFHTNETGRIFMMKIKTKIDGMIIGLFL